MVVICSVYKCRGSANVEMLYKQARYMVLCLGSAKPHSQAVFRAISPSTNDLRMRLGYAMLDSMH